MPEEYNPLDMIVTGHSGIPLLEDFPFARWRNPLSGVFTIMGYGGCNDGRPIVDLTYNYPDGSLNWSVEDAVWANLWEASYAHCFTCIEDTPYPIVSYNSECSFYSRIIPIDLEDGAAEGFIENAGFEYSIIADNYCCSTVEYDCGPPFICLRHNVNCYQANGVNTPDDYSDDVFCCDTISVCWTAFYNNDPNFAEEPPIDDNSYVLVNGEIYDRQSCIEIANGSNETERFYIFEVKNDCEFRNRKILETHCCSRKENLIVEVTGFENINESCTRYIKNVYEDCYCVPNLNSGSFYQEDTYNVRVIADFSPLNGTYIFPLFCQEGHPLRDYPVFFGEEFYGGNDICFSNNNFNSYYTGITLSIRVTTENRKYESGVCYADQESYFTTDVTLLVDVWAAPGGFIFKNPRMSCDYGKWWTACPDPLLPREAGSDSGGFSVDCNSLVDRCPSDSKCFVNDPLFWLSYCNQTQEGVNQFKIYGDSIIDNGISTFSINKDISGVCSSCGIDLYGQAPHIACNRCFGGGTLVETIFDNGCTTNLNPLYKLRNYNYRTFYT